MLHFKSYIPWRGVGRGLKSFSFNLILVEFPVKKKKMLTVYNEILKLRTSYFQDYIINS